MRNAMLSRNRNWLEHWSKLWRQERGMHVMKYVHFYIYECMLCCLIHTYCTCVHMCVDTCAIAYTNNMHMCRYIHTWLLTYIHQMGSTVFQNLIQNLLPVFLHNQQNPNVSVMEFKQSFLFAFGIWSVSDLWPSYGFMLFLAFRKKIEVTGDTQVFQEGSLGKTPEGWVYARLSSAN